MTKKFAYILNNDSENEPGNDLLSTNEHLSSCDEGNSNKEGTIEETRQVVPIDKKLVSTLKKPDVSHNKEAQNFLKKLREKQKTQLQEGRQYSWNFLIF